MLMLTDRCIDLQVAVKGLQVNCAVGRGPLGIDLLHVRLFVRSTGGINPGRAVAN